MASLPIPARLHVQVAISGVSAKRETSRNRLSLLTAHYTHLPEFFLPSPTLSPARQQGKV